MAGEYTINLTSGGSFTIRPGEINGPTPLNRINILEVDTANQYFVIYGDYTYRFVAGFTFAVINSTGNDGIYTVAPSGSEYQQLGVITDCDTPSSYFKLIGDWTRTFTAGRVFEIVNSTNNNGRYKTLSSVFAAGETTITIDTTAPSPFRTSVDDTVVDGKVKTNVTIIEVTTAIPNSTPDGQLLYGVPNIEIGTSLDLPGRGTENYGEGIVEALVHILENHASASSPSNPVPGQLWYDFTNLNVWDGSAWQIVSAPGGSFAPLNSSYVVIGADAILPNERVLTAGTGISIVDGGPGSSITINGSIVGVLDDLSDVIAPSPSTDDFLTFNGTNWVNGPGPGVVQYYNVSATSGQTVFNFPWTYDIGQNQLLVFVQGVKQLSGAAYTETSTSSITFSPGLTLGNIVEVFKVAKTAIAGSFAPQSASYVTVGAEGGLTNERVLTAGTGITITDGGANGPITIETSINVSGSHYVAKNTTIDATQTELFLDYPTNTQRMTIPSNTTWFFEVKVAARSSTIESAAYEIKGCIDNEAGTTVLFGSLIKTILAEEDVSWDVTAEADDTNDALVVKVTGAGGDTVRWVASVRVVEVTNP